MVSEEAKKHGVGPAYAGMILQNEERKKLDSGRPRVCGDDP